MITEHRVQKDESNALQNVLLIEAQKNSSRAACSTRVSVHLNTAQTTPTVNNICDHVKLNHISGHHLFWEGDNISHPARLCQIYTCFIVLAFRYPCVCVFVCRCVLGLSDYSKTGCESKSPSHQNVISVELHTPHLLLPHASGLTRAHAYTCTLC